MNWNIRLTFLTPLFSHGASDEPEIRPASIRGMLHHWFRLVGGGIEMERAVFGGVENKKGHPDWQAAASKIVVRVSDIRNAKKNQWPTLPHKSGGEASPRTALLAGTSCSVRISDRLGGLPAKAESLFHDAVLAWLLMGTLGYRSTRAAGSFAWESDDFPVPAPGDYEAAMRNLAAKSRKFEAVLLPTEYTSAEAARRIVSDSLKMEEHNRPLGGLPDPKYKLSRKTSPMKYRIVRLDNRFRIVAVWDARRNVTGNSPADLKALLEALRSRKPELGNQLAQSALWTG